MGTSATRSTSVLSKHIKNTSNTLARGTTYKQLTVHKVERKKDSQIQNRSRNNIRSVNDLNELRCLLYEGSSYSFSLSRFTVRCT